MHKQRIILYELNEVPKKLLDLYVKKRPHSSFAKILKKGIILNTETKDDGELHPWSTWPTIHRGVNNKLHNIRFINQDLSKASRYKPIWEILSSNKIDIGIFGSLQSFPPVKNKYVKFYLPDTFSPKPSAFPEELELFQKFNLELTSENKAISRKIKMKYFFDFVMLLSKNIISKKSTIKIIFQLIKEKLNRNNKKRRSIFQNVISFDLFLKNLKRDKPTFSTYFTNHVAGMMHRYWRDLFPEDFKIDIKNIDLFNSKSIIKAMDLADKNLRDLILFSQKENYNIWILSSMGQGAIDRGEYIPELSIFDFQKLLKKLNLDVEEYLMLPAMFPDFCIEAKTKNGLNNLRNVIKYLEDTNGNKIFTERYPPQGYKINLFLNSTLDAYLTKKLKFKNKTSHLKNFGIEVIKRDVGTGYHVPEGIFLVYGPDQDKFKKYTKKVIDTRLICPTILKQYQIKIPDYMGKPL